MDIATEEVEEGNIALFNKRLNRLMNKARMQDSTRVLRATAAYPERQPHSDFSLPLAGAGCYRQDGQVGG